MKRFVTAFLVVSIVASTFMTVGCVKKRKVASAAIAAGVGTALAVLGDQFKAKKRLGLDDRHIFGVRFRKKKVKPEVKSDDKEVAAKGEAFDKDMEGFLASRIGNKLPTNKGI